MAPPNNWVGTLDWTVAKKVCSQQDIERLACAFLNTEDVYKFDWASAAEQFGPEGLKPDSFKRSIWVIAKKIKEATEGGGEGGEGEGEGGKKAKAKAKGKGGKKRTAAEDCDGEDSGEEEPTAKKAKGGKRGKKGKKADLDAEAEDGGSADGEATIKAEIADGEMDDYFV